MIRVSICDDEENIRRQLREYLVRLQAELGEQMEIAEFASGAELTEKYRPETDILLLDIQMPGLDGLETAKEIRKFAPDVCIIFITNMVHFALKGYEVRPFGFMVKPVAYQQLKNELSAGLLQRRRRDAHFVFFSDARTRLQHQTDVRSVMYIEAKNHNLTVHLENRQIFCRSTLAEYERELRQYGFFRCHAAYLVNQRFIADIGQTQIRMTDGAELAVSKARRREFIAELMEYVGEQL